MSRRQSGERIVAAAEGEYMREQGFLTSDGRYVDRYLGYSIAYAAGQLLKKGGISPPMLTSEDVW